MRGTFLGIEQKIHYLKELGITAIQLLPIFDFNENRYDLGCVEIKDHIGNYWGYQPINYFAFHPKYSSSYGSGSLYEFKNMIKAFHKNSIFIYLYIFISK